MYRDDDDFEMALGMLESFANNPTVKILRTAWNESGIQAQELFGDSDGSDLPDNQIAVIYDDSLTHEEKVSNLRVMRGQDRPKATR
jgi:hypothetical protein